MPLKDLPVEPVLSDNMVSKTYIEECNKIQDKDNLLAFTNRWKALWTLNRGANKKVTPEEESIINGTYDAELSIKCLKINRNKQECEHVGNSKSCVGMHLALPLPLMFAFFMSQHYGVPVDTALVQANSRVGEIEF